MTTKTTATKTATKTTRRKTARKTAQNRAGGMAIPAGHPGDFRPVIFVPAGFAGQVSRGGFRGE